MGNRGLSNSLPLLQDAPSYENMHKQNAEYRRTHKGNTSNRLEHLSKPKIPSLPSLSRHRSKTNLRGEQTSRKKGKSPQRGRNDSSPMNTSRKEKVTSFSIDSIGSKPWNKGPGKLKMMDNRGLLKQQEVPRQKTRTNRFNAKPEIIDIRKVNNVGPVRGRATVYPQMQTERSNTGLKSNRNKGQPQSRANYPTARTQHDGGGTESYRGVGMYPLDSPQIGQAIQHYQNMQTYRGNRPSHITSESWVSYF